MKNASNNEQTAVHYNDWSEFITNASEHAATVSTTPHPEERVYGFVTTTDSNLDYLLEVSDGDRFIEGSIGKNYITASFKDEDGKVLNFKAVV